MSIASATCLYCGKEGHERFECPDCPEEVKEQLRQKQRDRLGAGDTRMRERRNSIDTYIPEDAGLSSSERKAGR